MSSDDHGCGRGPDGGGVDVPAVVNDCVGELLTRDGSTFVAKVRDTTFQ
jgi:hypothetical protein